MRKVPCLVLLAVAAGCAASEPEPPRDRSPIGPTPIELPIGSGADDPELHDLRSFALSQNPDLMAANRAAMVAMARARQAGLFPNPVLTFAFTDLPLGGGGRGSGGKEIMGIAQSIPLSDRIGAARREAESEAGLARAQMDLARRELILRIDEELAVYIRARERAKLTAEQLERMKEFEATQAKRVAAGDGLESDLTYTRVELEKARLDATEADRKVKTAEKVLEVTIGRELDMTRIKADLPLLAPPLDEETFTERARKASPGVILQERQAETARATLERAKEERIPDITIAIAGGYSNLSHDPVIEGGIAIPLPIFNRNQYRVEAALREVERSERAVAGEQISATIACAEVARDYESARLRVASYRERVIPAALENVKKSLEAFAAGKIPDRDVLVAQRSLIDNEIELVEARLALARAIARIERLTGANVPTKK